MKPEQLEAIRERAEKATKGPWEQVEEIDGIYGGRKTVVRTSAPSSRWTSRIVSVGQTRRHISDDAEDNTNFIANAREDVPALIDEVERLQKALDAVTPPTNPNKRPCVARNITLGGKA